MTTRARLRILRGELLVVLPAWLAARAVLFVGWLVARVADGAGDEPSSRALIDGLQAWDGGWYRDIASGGYDAVGEEGLRFFPLFPLVGRLGGSVAGGHEGLILVVVANVASLVALVLLRRLVVRELSGNAVADRSVWAMALWPASFVLAMAYAEALFLVAALGTFLALGERRWVVAGSLGAAAALIRPTGLMLVLPAAIEAGRHLRSVHWGERASRALAVIGPVLGTAGYFLWSHVAHGDALAPVRVQTELRGDARNPLVRLADGLGDFVGAERLGDGLHLPFAALLVVALVVVWRRLPAAYGAYSTGVLVLALGADNLNSLERYGLNAFPLMIGFALLVARPIAERVALVGCAAAMTGLTVLTYLDVYVP